MTQPSPFDQLQAAQANALDAVETLSHAVQGGVLVAWGCQMHDAGPIAGGVVPMVSLVLDEDGERRTLCLRPPQFPPAFPALIVLAAQLVAERMLRQNNESGAHAEWMKRNHGVQQLREANKKVIILPGRN